jgi:hypothetical protein
MTLVSLSRRLTACGGLAQRRHHRFTGMLEETEHSIGSVKIQLQRLSTLG